MGNKCRSTRPDLLSTKIAAILRRKIFGNTYRTLNFPSVIRKNHKFKNLIKYMQNAYRSTQSNLLHMKIPTLLLRKII